MALPPDRFVPSIKNLGIAFTSLGIIAYFSPHCKKKHIMRRVIDLTDTVFDSEKFAEVWSRVSNPAGDAASVQSTAAPTTELCFVRKTKESMAIRFIP